MIYETRTVTRELLDGLKKNNYTRRIKSHFMAYGTEYDFLRFFIIEESGEKTGVISVFNSAMMISTFEGKTLSDAALDELAGVVSMIMPLQIELECSYGKKLFSLVSDDYNCDKRTEFAFVSRNELPDMDVDELPKLDDVFRILAQSFPSIRDSYELWLTDTSHRVRRGLSQSFLLGDYTTATIQYIIDGVALIGHVATVPEERGKFHARRLLYWIGERLKRDGFEVRLFARPHRVSYYEEIGFREVGVDHVLERKINDE